jgi:ribonuclease PH
MNVVLTGSGKFVEVQATAEGRAFSGDELQQLLGLAATGIGQLVEHQRTLVRTHLGARSR